MKISNISFLYKILNGGGGDKAPPPPPPPAPPPPPPAEDSGPDPALQAEIEKQRALRFKAGQLDSQEPTGAGLNINEEETKKTTLLGGSGTTAK